MATWLKRKRSAQERMADEKTETRKQAETERAARGERLRRAGLFVLFSAVLLIPKALRLRRRRNLWNGLRVVAAVAGAVLAARGAGNWLGLWQGSGQGAAGMLLGGAAIVLALVIPPLKKAGSSDEKARELGALVALNGGFYRSGNGRQTRVRLYVAPERLHVLDERERPVLEIPMSEIAAVRVAGEGTERALVIEWRGGKAEFFYTGFFAEHLAEVARRTVDSRLRAKLRVLR